MEPPSRWARTGRVLLPCISPDTWCADGRTVYRFVVNPVRADWPCGLDCVPTSAGAAVPLTKMIAELAHTVDEYKENPAGLKEQMQGFQSLYSTTASVDNLCTVVDWQVAAAEGGAGGEGRCWPGPLAANADAD